MAALRGRRSAKPADHTRAQAAVSLPTAGPPDCSGAPLEAHDEWQTGDRRYLAEGTMALITTPAPTVATTEPAAA